LVFQRFYVVVGNFACAVLTINQHHRAFQLGKGTVNIMLLSHTDLSGKAKT
jgi:hypothetical protein